MKSTRLKIIDRILEVIGESHTIAVCSHMRPDGDCIGSSLGLALALLERGKEVTVWNQDPVPSKLRFLDPDQVIQAPRKINRPFDCVIAVDSASIERLGTAQEHITNRKVLINIDHHASNTRFGDINWIASCEPSSGELIYRLIKEAGWKLTPGCEFPSGFLDQAIDQFTAGGFATGDPVDVAEARITGVVVDVDQHLPVGDVFLRRAEALDAGGIDRDDAVEWTVDFSRRLDDLIRVEETQFGGHRILIPNGDFLAPLEQGQRQTKRRADAVAIRPHVAANCDGVALANHLKDAVNDLQSCRFHSGYRAGNPAQARREFEVHGRPDFGLRP